MKMKNTVRILALLLGAVLLFSGCAGTEGTSPRGTVDAADGTTAWDLSEDGTLTMTGTGTLSAVPVKKDQVKKVVVEPGFDAIGPGAFAEMSNLEEVQLPETVTEIGSEAFRNCKKLATVELPKAAKKVASSAFEGWEKTQTIVSEWYEGNAEYFEEWFEFARQFGDETVEYFKENNIPEETEAQLAEWWSQWKESGYWDELKKAGKEVGSAAVTEGKSWYEYWKDFGLYVTDDDAEKTVPEGRPSWWEDADEFTDYLGKRIRDAGVEIPEKFRNYYAEHKDEIDAFVEKAGEVAKNIGEKAGEIGEKVWDKLKDIFEKASEK